jgi:hypothetical protein
VPEQQDKQQIPEIEQVNDELTRGLELCHSLIDDYRTKLATNLNDVEPANDDGPDTDLD